MARKWSPAHGIASLAIGAALPWGLGVGVADTPSGQPIELPDELGDPDEDDIAAMVAALSDDSYEARQQATTSLWQLGDRVLPVLRKASDSADPEAADRASELVLYISAGVLFDSSEEVKVLVLRFSQGNLETKKKILTKLTELGQWKQVLHLARMEPDPAIRAQMSSDVRATAARAAREAVVEGDLELATEILQLSGQDDQALVIKAWFCCQRGLFDQELAKAKDIPGKAGALWRLALYRANGDLTEAIHEAEQAGRDDLEACLNVLAGNPLPWLDRNMDTALQDNILGMSCQIQKARLLGNTRKAGSIARELGRQAVDSDKASRVIVGLGANGFRDEALSLLERFDTNAAFDFYDSSESPEKALEVFGISKGAEAPYTEWVKKFTDRVVQDEDEDQYDRILLLAGFLVRHGEGEHALAVVTPLMDALQESGADIWFDLVASMPGYELGPQAIHLIEKRGNEDGEADLAVKNLLGSSKPVEHMWAALQKRNSQDLSKSLRQLALLSGLIPDPDGETDALHQSLLDDMEKEVGDAHEARGEALLNFAIRRHELGTASKVVDILAPVYARWTHTKLFLDTALFRWEQVEPRYAAREKEKPGNYENLVKWSMVLRKLNQEEKSRKVLDRALMLSMGDVKAMQRIAGQISSAGYQDEAYALAKKAAMMSDPEGDEFDRGVIYLASYGSEMMKQGDWKTASSIAEVYSRFTMRGRSASALVGVLNARFNADFCRGMVFLNEGDRERALTLLGTCQQLNPGSGSLADDFFPALRNAGVDREYNQWFENSYQHVLAACQRFPKAHNTHNTAAWLASRAVRRLDDAMRHAEKANQLRPSQGAYLDTMAEVWFAKGNRKKAVEWSEKAVQASISHAQGAPRDEGRVLVSYSELNKQLQRFKTGPLPTEAP